MAITKATTKKNASSTGAAPGTPASADDAGTPKFPRHMQIVNDTAQPWVIGGTYVAPGSSAKHHVRDEDALTRAHTDCKHILAVSDHYKPVAPKEGEAAKPAALRVVELDDEAGSDADAESGAASNAGGDNASA